MRCFFAACQNRNASHYFGHIQLDRHPRGILVLLPTGVLDDVEVLGLYNVIRLCGSDPPLCMLAVRRSEEIDWSRYGCSDLPCFSYESLTALVFVVPPFKANKGFKSGSGVIFDVPGHEASWLQDVQVERIASCEAKWFKHGTALNAGDGPEVVGVSLSVLDDVEFLFEKEAGWTRDIGSVRPEIQKEWRLLTDDLPALQMKSLIGSLGLFKFGREVTKKNKSLVDEFEMLQKTVTDKRSSQKGVEKELAQLKCSTAALAAKLAESEKSLKTARAEVASLEKQVLRADTKNANSDKLVDEIHKESEQRLVRLNVAHVRHSRAETLKRSLVTESVNFVDAVVQQLVYNGVSRLHQGLKMAYSTIRIPCHVALKRISGVAATRIRWKGEESREHKETEPPEEHPAEIGRCSAKATRRRGSGKGGSARR